VHVRRYVLDSFHKPCHKIYAPLGFSCQRSGVRLHSSAAGGSGVRLQKNEAMQNLMIFIKLVALTPEHFFVLIPDTRNLKPYHLLI
jgi:hypothetical protein